MGSVAAYRAHTILDATIHRTPGNTKCRNDNSNDLSSYVWYVSLVNMYGEFKKYSPKTIFRLMSPHVSLAL